jgi:hypothetical protein
LIVRWLSDRDVDVTVITAELLTDGEQHYMDTEQKIPVPETSPPEVNPDTSDKPWEADGRAWHLEEITNDESGALLEDLVSAIQDLEVLDGPRWGQKLYVSFRIGRKNRVLLRTQTEQIHLQIYDIDPSLIEEVELAERLNIDKEHVAAEDPIPGARRPGVQITCRGEEDVNTEAVAEEINQLLAKESN